MRASRAVPPIFLACRFTDSLFAARAAADADPGPTWMGVSQRQGYQTEVEASSGRASPPRNFAAGADARFAGKGEAGGCGWRV